MRNNFREAREKQKMTQDEIADKLGVARATYGRYESGQRECSFETLRKLADILCVSTDYLLGRESSACFLSRPQKTMLSLFDGLNCEGQSVIMTILGSLKISHPKKAKENVCNVRNSNNGNNYGSVGGNFTATVTLG